MAKSAEETIAWLERANNTKVITKTKIVKEKGKSTPCPPPQIIEKEVIKEVPKVVEKIVKVPCPDPEIHVEHLTIDQSDTPKDIKRKAIKSARKTAINKDAERVKVGANMIVGSGCIIRTQAETLTAKYALMELDDVVQSHLPDDNFAKNPLYPSECQEREYHYDKQLQLNVIRDAEHLDPDLLVNTASLVSTGPSVVDEAGIVLGGNSRIMKLKLAVVKYSNNYEEYKGLLSEQCDLYGIPCEMVAKLKRPVLVRVVNKEAGKNCIHYSTILNTDLTNERDEIGKAVSYAKYLTPDLLERLETLIERVNKDLTNPIETFSQLVNNGQIKDWIVARMRDAKIITDQNSTTYLQKYSGVLEFTDYGELIAKYMLLAIILEERKYIIAVKDKVLYILQTLPMWLKIKNLTHDYDIIPSVQNAILLEYRRRGEKTDINTFFDQTRMFEADNPIPLDEINKLCMKLMDVKSGKALRERLERYLEVATMSEEWLNGESLHEPDEIYSPTQALKYAINEKSRDTYKPTPPPKQEKHYQPKHVKGYYVPKSNLLDRNLTFFERIGKWVKDDLRGLH